MGPRSSIVAGLLAGVVTAVVVVVAVFALAPEPSGPAPRPSPSAPPDAEPSSPPSSEPSATPTPSGPTEPPAASATAAGGLFHVGEIAPALVVPQVGGGTIDLAALRGKPVWVHVWVDAEGIVRDGAAGGIGPDMVARGLGTILPGVDVRP